MSQILVIDDTKNIRKMIKLTLAQVGYDIAEAEDGSQGLERFGNGAGWDLTLIDQRMPTMEGIEVVREARRRDPAARLIMMTAFASSELAAQVLRLGALDFLRKPFSTANLRGAVQTALQLERKATTPEASASNCRCPANRSFRFPAFLTASMASAFGQSSHFPTLENHPA
jgi:two-component system response regulator AtoC